MFRTLLLSLLLTSDAHAFLYREFPDIPQVASSPKATPAPKIQSVGVTTLPVNAQINLPLLQEEQQRYWPNHPLPVTQAGQIEQESCVSLKSLKCWNSTTTLQVKYKGTDQLREYGFGLGQTTVTYKADGKERFNVWREMRERNATALAEWTWENRFDARLQLRAMVLYDRQLYKQLSGTTSDPTQQLWFSYSAYNGGLSGVLQDIRQCKSTPNCRSDVWFNSKGLGVKDVSSKSRVRAHGYGMSFFDINRNYITSIQSRSVKYAPYYKD